MASVTFLAREICMGYWSVTLIAYVEAHQTVVFPIQESLRCWVSGYERAHQAFLAGAARSTGLGSELSRTGVNEAPWGSGVDWGSEQEVLGELGLWCGRPVTLGALTRSGREDLIVPVARKAVSCMVGGMLGAMFEFGDRTGRVGELLALLGDAIPRGRVGEQVEAGWSTWVSDELPKVVAHPLTDPSYRAWLLEQLASDGRV